MCAQFRRWVCAPSDLVDLTPMSARDLIIECFSQAQYETLKLSPPADGLSVDLGSVREEARRAVRDAFVRAGDDFENPSKSSLERVVEALTDQSKRASTPTEIIRHHEQQVAMILEGLTD
jgi:hypothetical protein